MGPTCGRRNESHSIMIRYDHYHKVGTSSLSLLQRRLVYNLLLNHITYHLPQCRLPTDRNTVTHFAQQVTMTMFVRQCNILLRIYRQMYVMPRSRMIFQRIVRLLRVTNHSSMLYPPAYGCLGTTKSIISRFLNSTVLSKMSFAEWLFVWLPVPMIISHKIPGRKFLMSATGLR